MRTTRTFTFGVAALAALALGACGGDDGGGAATTATDPDEARLAWAECLREQGVDVPDPGPDGKTLMRLDGQIAPEQMERAQEACRALQEQAAPQLSDEQRAEIMDQFVAFAECMREHGIDMPDPQAGPGGGVIMRAEKGTMPDPQSPAFQEAQAACEDLQPTPPGR